MEVPKYVRGANFVDKQIGDELILVPLVDQVAHMTEVFTLNEVGAFIWKCLEQPQTLNQLVENVVNTFDVDAKMALNDVQTFLEQSTAKRIILFA